ncbi:MULTISPECIES: MAPEG family protein [unclassified Sphingomonas]|uniref:MAPEG family protein n=1 Tax=unclassified Sphingomonas TaxID=196159 RepID=UPI000BCF92DF|nr:MAG: GST-like protein [Sphingomonas sp. 32-62-10]
MLVTLPITLVAAGGAALVNFWLAMRVGNVRRAAKVSIGDGGDMTLIARMRAQANFIEYTPIVLVLIGAIELSQGSSAWLWVVAVLYLLGRIGHGLGMDGWLPGRMGGTLISLFTMLGLGIYALTIPFLTFADPVKVVPVTVQQPTG